MEESTHNAGEQGIPPMSTSTEELLDRLIRQAKDETQVPSADDRPPAQSSPLNGILGGLLANPTLLQALPQLMSGLGQLTGGGHRSSSEGGEQPSDGPSPPKRAPTVDRHIALLCALKPYLSRDRQKAADDMINLCRVWSTLQSIGVTLPWLTSSLTGTGEGDVRDDKEVR